MGFVQAIKADPTKRYTQGYRYRAMLKYAIRRPISYITDI